MSLIMVEYLCPEHGRFESLESRPAPQVAPCPTGCGEWAELVISAPAGFSQFVTFERGKLAEPPSPKFLDTSGYGLRKQSYQEWKADLATKQSEERRKELKGKL